MEVVAKHKIIKETVVFLLMKMHNGLLTLLMLMMR
jgi:hypothetical protein